MSANIKIGGNIINNVSAIDVESASTPGTMVRFTEGSGSAEIPSIVYDDEASSHVLTTEQYNILLNNKQVVIEFESGLYDKYVWTKSYEDEYQLTYSRIAVGDYTTNLDAFWFSVDKETKEVEVSHNEEFFPIYANPPSFSNATALQAVMIGNTLYRIPVGFTVTITGYTSGGITLYKADGTKQSISQTGTFTNVIAIEHTSTTLTYYSGAYEELKNAVEYNQGNMSSVGGIRPLSNITISNMYLGGGRI